MRTPPDSQISKTRSGESGLASQPLEHFLYGGYFVCFVLQVSRDNYQRGGVGILNHQYLSFSELPFSRHVRIPLWSEGFVSLKRV